MAAKLANAVAFANAATERCRESLPVDVKAIRKASGMTQEAFASTYQPVDEMPLPHTKRNILRQPRAT
ncbi:MAG TPA: hypothetical protein VGN83_18745 [Falsiroseomonas sp.]|jgi:DNA-binding transcriptional regulator YiaG|nr:hypothetical protein [Falsiroseomonas sp.]